MGRSGAGGAALALTIIVARARTRECSWRVRPAGGRTPGGASRTIIFSARDSEPELVRPRVRSRSIVWEVARPGACQDEVGTPRSDRGTRSPAPVRVAASIADLAGSARCPGAAVPGAWPRALRARGRPLEHRLGVSSSRCSIACSTTSAALLGQPVCCAGPWAFGRAGYRCLRAPRETRAPRSARPPTGVAARAPTERAAGCARAAPRGESSSASCAIICILSISHESASSMAFGRSARVTSTIAGQRRPVTRVFQDGSLLPMARCRI